VVLIESCCYGHQFLGKSDRRFQLLRECKYFAKIVTDLVAYLSNGGAPMEDLDDDSVTSVPTGVK
jgi:hypothetical protein